MIVLRLLWWLFYWLLIAALAAVAYIVCSVPFTGETALLSGLFGVAVTGFAGLMFAPTRKGGRT